MGRPSKLTPEVTKRLTEAIRAGNYYEAACAYAGIHYSTFRKWMQKGETAKSGKFREFFEAITRAEYEAEVRMVALWQKHMPEDYRAIRDFLERRYPDRWGRKRLDIEHKGQLEVRYDDGVKRIEQQLEQDDKSRELLKEFFRRSKEIGED